ncbi:MAG: prepilin-type N-terminal cleavage/methylation domain-containing protein [Oscillospiraceae bacterium]|nr:prepilin-type N-terminal cleavage/methylation domain-containing protein [Oscillospiraceae bacterium]
MLSYSYINRMELCGTEGTAGMKRIRARLSAQEGFSLVELIVVIAILAILAAVAVPVYSGYVKKANDAAVTTELVSILTAAQAANATNANALTEISIDVNGDIEFVFYNSTAEPSNFDDNFSTLYDDANLKTLLGNSASYTNGARWTPDGGWVGETTVDPTSTPTS